ncbi:MAG: ribosomal L7Ae/L30e/S12e/Gadd45 family protein [Syntrophomonas sp.]|uniref:L7Ae/L30e/S12e/Gadd45 family ribosomal protein n=1 Tax=Syntrophomonas sp. TaxID=2053627 RepID=UPI002611D60B|nr:ribosomal L7Ae/L30e/S12e/Gadd45 family protein [Syntrophomonas sp.]MDD2510019.1 ribosomal L7Ae/L30e/S12e/Gadd45 family protein [Syntrophomonas sp.]MDD4626104.1 ribosomal L7Ae/L30e/S12e/Gadd45 family protein [Syntrophomonas sp.]
MKKSYAVLGFAQKAGKVSSGALAAKSSIIRRRAFLLIISNDIAENTKQGLISSCQKQKIPWIILGNKYEIGASIGKAYRVAVTINDQGMAESLIKSLEAVGAKVSTGVVEWQK